VIIMAGIGQGGMSRAVITIEEARAKLTDALEAGTTTPNEGPGSTDGP
jgi:adenosylcobinamide amidohydrolase